MHIVLHTGNKKQIHIYEWIYMSAVVYIKDIIIIDEVLNCLFVLIHFQLNCSSTPYLFIFYLSSSKQLQHTISIYFLSSDSLSGCNKVIKLSISQAGYRLCPAVSTSTCFTIYIYILLSVCGEHQMSFLFPTKCAL